MFFLYFWTTIRIRPGVEKIREMTGVERLKEFMGEQRLRRLAYVERMDEEKRPAKATALRC